ncbi:hypothetical protein [Helicobacter marmotae]|uniref:hypothetical protein n=1 Tax=Helicobacter marmotae TaxID=152490 RepID=UPI0011C047E1|nr:hypothetical protein [Helicobacter marmotae]
MPFLVRSNRTNLATRKGNELISSSGRQRWSEELLLKPLANLPYCHFEPPLGGGELLFEIASKCWIYCHVYSEAKNLSYLLRTP